MPSIALHKRVSLAGIADGWDDCFAIVSLATYDEVKKVRNLSTDTQVNEDDGYKFQTELVTKHFVRGQVLTDLDDGTEGLGDLSVEDAIAYMPLSNELFYAIMGVAPDPKALSTPTETSSTSQLTDSTSNSKTTS